jgi:hypothetical protein
VIVVDVVKNRSQSDHSIISHSHRKSHTFITALIATKITLLDTVPLPTDKSHIHGFGGKSVYQE